ncbi:hypothetical protein LIHA111178_06470 [Litorimonas haliclonae]
MLNKALLNLQQNLNFQLIRRLIDLINADRLEIITSSNGQRDSDIGIAFFIIGVFASAFET